MKLKTELKTVLEKAESRWRGQALKKISSTLKNMDKKSSFPKIWNKFIASKL